MITVIPSAQRFSDEIDWLKTYWHFSFSHYYDPANMHFGHLRVFNEDWIKPGGGFPMHPHNDMEIITYIINGTLEHKDNLGNHGTIKAGEVQRMTAGSGIVHSEFNPSDKEDCHLLQMWVMPDQKNLEPGWEQEQTRTNARKGKLLPIISGQNSAHDTMKINQDATFFISSLSTGENLTHSIETGRKLYLFVISGSLLLNGNSLSTGDQARCKDETDFSLNVKEDLELLMIDMA